MEQHTQLPCIFWALTGASWCSEDHQNHHDLWRVPHTTAISCSPRRLLGGGQAALGRGEVVEVVGKGRQNEGHHGAGEGANDGVDQAVEGEGNRNEPQRQCCTQWTVAGVRGGAKVMVKHSHRAARTERCNSRRDPWLLSHPV